MANNTGDCAIDAIHQALDALERCRAPRLKEPAQKAASFPKPPVAEDEETARLNAIVKLQANIRGRNARRQKPTTGSSRRFLSLAKSVAAAGGSEAWNLALPETEALWGILDQTCKAHSTDDALADLRGIMSLGHNIWAYSYMRVLYKHNINVFFGCLMAEPAMLMPVVYTPTVGEACQKFGIMPFYSRGCYVSITDRGNIVAVLEDYAKSHLGKNDDGTYACDCIVFSDGGRILGLGDLGAWGMGIPIGKLDLYTTCAGVNPHRTVPVIIDAGIYDKNGNTAKIDIRNHPRYTGLKQDRVTEKSAQGTTVNSAYYGEGNMIDEFMSAACTVFGPNVLLQFEDFNSNDAFPLLETYRTKYCSYNDDIQGTAAVTCAGILGAIKIKSPAAKDLLSLLSQERILLHGSGSANLGAASLLYHEGQMPIENIGMTNSRGLMWKSADGSEGTFRNEEQKAFSVSPQPDFPHKELVDIVGHMKPTVLVGATGRTPNCFDQPVIEKMMEVNGSDRPVVFALSNPKTQAEVTAANAYNWSNGRVIFGSGTKFDPVAIDGKTHEPGMVNNVYIFPGMSFGAVQCSASTIPDSLFLKAAEAVANSLTDQDIAEDRVMPPLTRIREVSLNVATAVVMQCQREGIARKAIGTSEEEVKAKLAAAMWTPDEESMTVVDEPFPEHTMGADCHIDEHDCIE